MSTFLIDRGYKPRSEGYELRQTELNDIASDIIFQTTGVRVTVEIEPNEDENDLVAYINEPATQAEVDAIYKSPFVLDDAYQTMQSLFRAMDPSGNIWAEVGHQDGFTKEWVHYIHMTPAAKTDIQDALERALAVALEGSREETIIAINQAFKLTKPVKEV